MHIVNIYLYYNISRVSSQLYGLSTPIDIYGIIGTMIKKMIRPFQDVLLERKLCVGCTSPLTKAKKLGNLSDTRTMVECKCKRRYVYEKELAAFKRATFAEEQQLTSDMAKGRSW